MGLLSASVKTAFEARNNASSGSGNYLNPGSISEGAKTRITFLGDDLEARATEQGAVVGDAVARPFFAFCVWNYDTESVQVFQFSQQSLARPLIEALSDEEVEAEVTLYDFVISAIGTGRDKRYSVLPMPGKRRTPAVDKKITAAWEAVEAKGFSLDVLLTGGDPFKGPL